MRLLSRLVWALIFFTAFAFALNNQQQVTVRWFFGLDWQAPLVIVVLLAFAAGCAVGVLAMVPAWWRHRQVAKMSASGTAAAGHTAATAITPSRPGSGMSST